MSSEEYLQGLINGDSYAITAIYSDIKPIVNRWIIKNNGSIDDADDIFHNALEALLINYSEIKVDFKALLIRIAKNKWIDELRKKSKKRNVNLDTYQQELFEESTENEFIECEQENLKYSLFNLTFEQLSELCQKLIILIKKEKTTTQIVEQLKFQNKNTMYRRKFACMEKWKKLIEEHKDYQIIKQ